MKTKISIVDDHSMISKAISDMINTSDQYETISTSINGEDFILYIENDTNPKPDIVLMDVNMPHKNGIETTEWLTENYPSIKVIALTMEDNEKSIIKMIKAGAKGYLLKDMDTDILFEAIETVQTKGSFYTDMVTQALIKINEETEEKDALMNELRPRELEFIQWACTDLTYREIADKMFLSPKTIDGYRESVFEKTGVKSRVGLVLFSIKNNLVDQTDN